MRDIELYSQISIEYISLIYFKNWPMSFLCAITLTACQLHTAHIREIYDIDMYVYIDELSRLTQSSMYLNNFPKVTFVTCD